MAATMHSFLMSDWPNEGATIYFGPAVPTAPDGNTYRPGDMIFNRTIPYNGVLPPGSPAYWYCNVGGAGGTATFIPIGAGGSTFLATENGANNAIATAAGSGPLLYTGLSVRVLLAHTLQAGANTFAYNGGAAKNIKSSRNPASDIATGYSATGVITLTWDGTEWLDDSQ